MTSVPVSEITAEAREVRFSRVAAAVVFGVLWGIGWLAGSLWLVLAVTGVAVRRGWRDGTGHEPPPAPLPAPQPPLSDQRIR